MTALKSTRPFGGMDKPSNCFHLQRMWGLKQSYHGLDTKESTGSFNTITFMTAHGNSLNHSFSESNIGSWSYCSTKLKYGGICAKRQPTCQRKLQVQHCHKMGRILQNSAMTKSKIGAMSTLIQIYVKMCLYIISLLSLCCTLSLTESDVCRNLFHT